MTPEAVGQSLRAALGERLIDERVVERAVGTKESHLIYDLWFVVPPDALHDAVAHLVRAHQPHFTVISGDDLGESIAFNYHFTVGWGCRYGESTVNLRTVVSKAHLCLPTITDLIPGAQTAEREKREFYGVEIVGIPDTRNLFLPEGSPLHPWRRDLESETLRSVKRIVEWEKADE